MQTALRKLSSSLRWLINELGSTGNSQRPCPLRLEVLEERLAPATFMQSASVGAQISANGVSSNRSPVIESSSSATTPNPINIAWQDSVTDPTTGTTGSDSVAFLAAINSNAKADNWRCPPP